MKKSCKTSAATEEDTLSETMSQLNIASAASTHPADDQDQTAPNHSLDFAESLPTPAPGLTNQKTRAVGQNEAMTVMVLDATEPFEYESTKNEVKVMFHARVATVNECFNVEVLNMNLIKKFTKNNVIKIANYVKVNGILEITEKSSVTEVGPDEKIEVPQKLITVAKKTPMISDINRIFCGEPFYGSFTLNKKKYDKTNIVYEMKDDTGTIDMEVSGIRFDVKCEEGDTLQLFGFELTKTNGQVKLVSGKHSFIKVLKAGRKKISLSPSKPN